MLLVGCTPQRIGMGRFVRSRAIVVRVIHLVRVSRGIGDLRFAKALRYSLAIEVVVLQGVPFDPEVSLSWLFFACWLSGWSDGFDAIDQVGVLAIVSGVVEVD